MLKRLSCMVSLAVVSIMNSAPVTFLSPNVLNVPSGFTISSTGLYQLTDDVVFTNLANSQNGITITSSSVTLDLNGRALTGIAGATGQSAISIAPGGYTNIRIRNGTINNWSSNGILSTGLLTDLFLENLNIQYINGAAGTGSILLTSTTRRGYIKNCIMTGNPVSDGIRLIGGYAAAEIANCTVMGVGGAACNLQTATAVMIQGCRFNRSATGIAVGLATAVCIINSVANLNVGNGIQFSLTSSSFIQGCFVLKNGTGGITLDAGSGVNLVKNCIAVSNGTAGITNNSSNSVVMSCLATRNTPTNMTGSGPIGAINIFNSVPVPAGTVIDATSNIVVHGQTS
jgi:hypothetical protein